MKNFPTVSILIPVYNRQSLVGVCLSSALAQTFEDIEIIVVDNASTDGTWDVCHDIAVRDPRIRLYRNDTNLGPVRNWLRCLELAQGRYGKLLFSDDTLAPDFLAKCIPFFEDDNVGFVFTSVASGTTPEQTQIHYPFARESGLFSSARYINAALWQRHVPVSPGAALFRIDDMRNNLCLSIPSPSLHDFCEHGAGPDLLIYLLTARAYQSVAFVSEPLVFFRDHKDSLSITTNRIYLLRCYRQARLWFAARYLGDTRLLRRILAYEWRRECRESGKWRSPSAILGQYLDVPVGLSLGDFVHAFLGRDKEMQ